MTLNAVIALFVRFLPNSIDFQADYITAFEDRPIMFLKSVLLSSRPGLGLEDHRGHPMKVLALALTPQALALALALALRLFPHDPDHVVAVRVCSAHTHSVIWHMTVCHFLFRNVSQTCM